MEKEYHLLIDSIKDYAIFMMDSTGHIITWNTGAERLKGYSEKEAIGKHFSMLFTPEDQESGKPEKELEAALAKGRYEEEGWRMRKNGLRFWANIILTPIFSESKKHIGFAKVTRDLTEKRRSEELYLLLVSQVKEYAIFMMDPQGYILTWNEGAQHIKGYTSPEIIGTHFSAFYTPEDLKIQKPKLALATALTEGKYEEEGWRVRKDGSRFWASVLITPVYKDEHIGFAKVTRDMTRRKEMERLVQANTILEATNKELERFAFIASHDLKEPLRKISTFAHLILNDRKHELLSIHKDYLNKILTSSKRMDTLINDILNFSTLSYKGQFEKKSLTDIVTDSLELLEQSIKEKNAVIRYGNLPEAVIIPAQMRQLFQNLISNSLKFSKKDVPPIIHIHHAFVQKKQLATDQLWPADQYLQIVIEDNGIGFRQEYAEKIFNLFNRLHGISAYEGTGIGLAICKKIVENHGGTITAHSKPGEGARFVITIPD